jgi:hypothetical protein
MLLEPLSTGVSHKLLRSQIFGLGRLNNWEDRQEIRKIGSPELNKNYHFGEALKPRQ